MRIERAVAMVVVTLVAMVGAAIWQAERRGAEREAEASVDRTIWGPYLREFDVAVAARNRDMARRLWREAWHASLATREWHGPLAAGDAALRLGDLLGSRGLTLADARRAYRAALYRARGERSVEGVLRVAQAFDAIGDREAADGARRIARALLDAERSTRRPGASGRTDERAASLP
jgi:hypothetical protein